MYNTKLKDIDLSNCNISGIVSDIKSLDGLIIDRFDSHELVRLLGVKFKE